MFLEHGELQKLHINDIHLGGVVHGIDRAKCAIIITEKPKDVYLEIKNTTNHGATLFKGVGLYKGEERSLVYSVISSDELHLVIRNIKKVDSKAFIDVIHSDRVDGWFFQRPTT